MILVDVNLLLYAHVASFQQHTAAREWLNSQIRDQIRVGLPWTSLLAFLRLATNPRVFSQPEPIERAWAQVEKWLSWPSTWIPQPGQDHQRILAGLLAPGVTGNLIPDAHLAALALEHGLTVCSCDSGFAKFDGVRWIDPLRNGS